MVEGIAPRPPPPTIQPHGLSTKKTDCVLYSAVTPASWEPIKNTEDAPTGGVCEKLVRVLPLLESQKPISLARTVLSIPSGTLYLGAAAVSLGDLAVLLTQPKVGIATTLLAIPVAIGLVIGGQVNGVVQGTTPVNLQSILGPRLRD